MIQTGDGLRLVAFLVFRSLIWKACTKKIYSSIPIQVQWKKLMKRDYSFSASHFCWTLYPMFSRTGDECVRVLLWVHLRKTSKIRSLVLRARRWFVIMQIFVSDVTVAGFLDLLHDNWILADSFSQVGNKNFWMISMIESIVDAFGYWLMMPKVGQCHLEKTRACVSDWAISSTKT